MDSRKKGNRIRVIFGVGISLIVVIASFSAIIFWPESDESPYNINFSEVQVWGDDPNAEWIEIYQWNSDSVNLEGWTLQVDRGPKWQLPSMDIAEFNYVNIHLGGDTEWLVINPLSQGKNIFLDLEDEGLPDPGGEIILRDEENRIVDVIVYGNAATSLPEFWSPAGGNIYGINHSNTFSIWGEDLGNATNWYESNATPNSANMYSFMAVGGQVVVFNGYSFGPINFTDYLSIDLTGQPIEVECHPTSKKYKKDIEEYAKYSLKFFNESGYGTARLGPDGKIDIHVGKGKRNETCGACWNNGTVIIDLGTLNPDSFAANVSRKYCVEHELFHAVQNRVEDGNTNSMGSKFYSEGMATFMGIRSVMGNFNLTMEEAMIHLMLVDDHNWWEHGTTLNTSVFYYWASNYHDYMQAFFLFKYLSETYGNNTILEIHKRTKRYLNGTVIKSPRQAIEEVVGKSFEEILREYYLWRIFNAEIDNGLPNVGPDYVTLTEGNATSDEFKIEPGGAALEEFIVGTPHDLLFHFNVTGKMKITVLIYYLNGTIEEFHYDIFPPPAQNPGVAVNVLGVEKVQILKQNLDPRYYRRINTTCEPIYVTTPNGAFGNATDLQYHDGTHMDTVSNLGSLPHFADPTREDDTSYWFSSGKEWLIGETYQIRLYQNHHSFPEMSAPYAGSISGFGYEIYNGAGILMFVGDTGDIFADPMMYIPQNTFEVGEEEMYYIRIIPNGFMGCFELVVDDLN